MYSALQDQNHRITRRSISGARPTRQFGSFSVPVANTKSVIAFLCLFDGLRTPSIRRLGRKPHTICNKPLLTFDPSFYAPSSTKALSELYKTSINCPSEIAVDPSVQTVLDLLRVHITSIPPHRVLLHYYGHGCYEPTESNLYFFSDDRLRYKPLKVASILQSCACPICIVLDCPKAAILAKIILATKKDTFAFFACAANEKLPLSTSIPLDLFSSCLFQPFKTAMWYQEQNHCSIFASSPPEEERLRNEKLMKQLLNVILEAICFDSQDRETFELFTRDPAISAMFRGFALAQRVLMSYNIHPSTIPELKPMMTSVLWDYWDLAVDTCTTLPKHAAQETIFLLFMKTFDTYPKLGSLPIFSFFLNITRLHDDAAQHLFSYMDSTPEAAETASHTTLPTTIINIELPSAASLIILAKMMAASQHSFFLSMSPTHFTLTDDEFILSAGMIAMTIASYISWLPMYKKFILLCIDHANECAPFSSLLLGVIMEKTSGTCYSDDFSDSFLPLLQDSRSDIRASALYSLGFSKNPKVIDRIKVFLDDESPIVRIQAFYALLLTYKLVKDESLFESIGMLESDSNPDVKNQYNIMRPHFQRIKHGLNDAAICSNNPIIKHFMHSVKEIHFDQRYDSNIFDIKFPGPEKHPGLYNDRNQRVGSYNVKKY